MQWEEAAPASPPPPPCCRFLPSLNAAAYYDNCEITAFFHQNGDIDICVQDGALRRGDSFGFVFIQTSKESDR